MVMSKSKIGEKQEWVRATSNDSVEKTKEILNG